MALNGGGRSWSETKEDALRVSEEEGTNRESVGISVKEKGVFTSKARCYVLQSFALPKLVTPHHIFFAALINQC